MGLLVVVEVVLVVVVVVLVEVVVLVVVVVLVEVVVVVELVVVFTTGGKLTIIIIAVTMNKRLRASADRNMQSIDCEQQK